MRLLATVALVALGCDAAPDAPTYRRDVKPILDANCVRCHGNVPRGGAPDRFRLDVFSDLDTDDGKARIGAGLVSGFIAARTHAETMPPVTPLSDRQIETLQRWSVFGDFPAAEGEPDADNRLPEMELLGLETDAEGVVTVNYVISDPDFEVVTGRLRATPVGGGESIEVTRELYSGRRAARWDTGVIDEGNYVLSARIDDGQAGRAIEIGEIAVVHPGGNRAPAPEICNLSRSEILALDDLPFSLEVAASDDGPALDSISVFAERGDRSIEVGARANVVASSCATAAAIELDLSQLDPRVDWRLRVVASDGARSRAIRSLPIIVGDVADADAPSFSREVQPIFERRCSGCHGADLAPIGAIFTLIANAQDIDGAIYRRVIQEQTMPPRSAELLVEGFEPMTAEERAVVASWILAGGPDE